ncbi:MAG: bifunctional methylenetetrahydrofolate dehydrogenase/methenyltetrahydrofolate cyclohydrolase FolD [Methanomicrobiales archaeon]|nr:bifunctional methylenetetrahydrofolate dehydrogenase/methenyltetrahydrofolate cyclohydrolase FolD [Methanomicrobiales archaeon]
MILDGKKISDKRLEILNEEIMDSGLYPQLATIVVGDDPASHLYVKMKRQACERVGIGSVKIEMPVRTTTEALIEKITSINRDSVIDGILVQLPLPKQVDSRRVFSAIAPDKDVDGFHPCNLGRLFSGHPLFSPCTPLGIMILLAEYDLPVAGKDAVVIGRSMDVGRPCAALLLNADATVTTCHSATKNLENITSRADILVSAVGKAGFITPSMVRDGAIVIDVGINYVDGKLTGDVLFDSVKDKAAWITPVPGGVGPMTIAALMENTFKAARLRECTSVT